MTNFRIIGIAIKDRIKEAGKTQQVLSKHANIIRSRLGFHEVNEYTCSRIGFIILQLIDKEHEYLQLMNDLKEIGGIEVKEMNFEL